MMWRFDQQNDLNTHRNLVGRLPLLPKKVNASPNDMIYAEKLPHYLKINAPAQLLHEMFYKNNPEFRQAIATSDLPFKAHERFGKQDLRPWSDLYCQLAKLIWSPERFASFVDEGLL